MISDNEIIQEIDELRTMVTECQRGAKILANDINRGTGGREVALAITALQEVQSWLRYAQEELNIPRGGYELQV